MRVCVQALGATGLVLSEDGDGDVKVEVSGGVWTFNPACCTRLAPTAMAADKKHRSDNSSEASTDDDDDNTDDDDDDEQETIRMFCLVNILLLSCEM